jgi:hypothetical protein
MDISGPPTDYLEQIDQQLAALSEETRVMKEKYGFEGISEAESILALRKKQKAAKQPKKYIGDGKASSSEVRFNYDTLVEVIPEEKPIKPVIIRPEISSEWVAANKMEPDLKAFYDKKRFEKQVFKMEDFSLTREKNPGVEAFDSYMAHFALLNL